MLHFLLSYRATARPPDDCRRSEAGPCAFAHSSDSLAESEHANSRRRDTGRTHRAIGYELDYVGTTFIAENGVISIGGSLIQPHIVNIRHQPLCELSNSLPWCTIRRTVGDDWQRLVEEARLLMLPPSPPASIFDIAAAAARDELLRVQNRACRSSTRVCEQQREMS